MMPSGPEKLQGNLFVSSLKLYQAKIRILEPLIGLLALGG